MAGLIFAFDLDQTLIDSEGAFEELDADERKPVAEQKVWNIIHQRLNMTLITKVLVPACALRDSGVGIDAICLLTNNSSREYVANIALYLKELMKEAHDERLEKLRKEGNKPNKTIKKIENEGKKRRESTPKLNSFGLSSNNRGKKRNPPTGGWV